MPGFRETLASGFSAPIPNTALTLLKGLYATHPTSQHVPVLDNDKHAFPLSAYLASLDIAPKIHAHDAASGSLTGDSYALYSHDVKDHSVFSEVIAGRSTFVIDGVEYTAYKATWQYNWDDHYFYDLVFDATDATPGEKLAGLVYKYGFTLRKQIWVYQGGSWSADKELYQGIQGASWEDIVLDEAFVQGIRRDTKVFFESRQIYEELGMTWKRGILLLGPPGNGKTESIKALLKESNYPALYVKSFTTQAGPEEGVRSIFRHARKHAPCILVIEDLDAMVTKKVRSFFLNELDGLAANAGILTLATTNHPERIDDAIVNRPSRFDVKYTFTLPDETLRAAFAKKWLNKIAAGVKGTSRVMRGVQFESPDEEIAHKVAAQTAGFSFAFMKELFVSFLLSVAHHRSTQLSLSETPEELLFKQIDFLSAQMIKKVEDEAKEEKKAKDAGKKDGKKDGEAEQDEDAEQEEGYCRPLPRENTREHDGTQF